MPLIYAWELVTVLKLSKTLKQTHARDKTKKHIMLLKITTYKMHDMKQYKKNKTETHTQEENNITKRNESTSCKIIGQ